MHCGTGVSWGRKYSDFIQKANIAEKNNNRKQTKLYQSTGHNGNEKMDKCGFRRSMFFGCKHTALSRDQQRIAKRGNSVVVVVPTQKLKVDTKKTRAMFLVKLDTKS